MKIDRERLIDDAVSRVDDCLAGRRGYPVVDAPLENRERQCPAAEHDVVKLADIERVAERRARALA